MKTFEKRYNVRIDVLVGLKISIGSILLPQKSKHIKTYKIRAPNFLSSNF